MVFRTGQLGGQQWIFGPASKIFIKNLKTRENEERKMVSNGFSARQNDVNLKMSRKFQTRNLFNKFEITKQ